MYEHIYLIYFICEWIKLYLHLHSRKNAQINFKCLCFLKNTVGSTSGCGYTNAGTVWLFPFSNPNSDGILPGMNLRMSVNTHPSGWTYFLLFKQQKITESTQVRLKLLWAERNASWFYLKILVCILYVIFWNDIQKL